MIVRLFDIDTHKGDAITSKYETLGNKLNLLKVVAGLAIKSTRAQQAFNKIAADADTVVTERNRLFHGRWLGTSGTITFKIAFKAQGKLTKQIHHFTPKQVRAIPLPTAGDADEALLQIREYFRIRFGKPERIREHVRRHWGTVNRNVEKRHSA